MAVSLNGADIITELGDHHLIAVDGGEIKRIKATDLPGGGGGGSPQLWQRPELRGTAATSGGAAGIKGTPFVTTGEVTINSLVAVMRPATASTLPLEIVLATINASNVVQSVDGRGVASLTTYGANADRKAVVDIPPVTYPAGTIFAVLVFQQGQATNFALPSASYNTIEEFMQPLPMSFHGTFATGWFVSAVAADVTVGLTLTRQGSAIGPGGVFAAAT